MDKITATLSGNMTNAMQTSYSNNAELKIDIPYSNSYVTYRLQIIAYTNNVVTGKKITNITACRNKTFGEATTEVLADGTAMLGGVVTGIVNGAFVQPVMAAASGIDFIINIGNPEQYESNQKWRDGLIEKAENFMISNLPAEQYYYYNCGIEGGEISELCVGSVYIVKGVMGVVTKLENMGHGVKGAQMLLDSGDELLMMAGKDSKNVAVVAAENLDDAINILAKYGDDFGKMGTYVKNPNISIDWAQYAKHGAERMLQRGITKEMVESFIKNGKVLSQNAGSKFAYITREGVAIISKEGKLITAWTSIDFDDNMIAIVARLFGG